MVRRNQGYEVETHILPSPPISPKTSKRTVSGASFVETFLLFHQGSQLRWTFFPLTELPAFVMTMLYSSFLATALCAATVTWAVMPAVGRLAQRIGAIDEPVWRSSHKTPTPRLGGLGIVFGGLAGVSALLLSSYFGGPNTEVAASLELTRKVDPSAWFGLLIGGWMIFIMGLLDDITSMSAKNKLAVQIVGTFIIAISGCSVLGLDFAGYSMELGWLAIPATCFWLLSTTNAVNLMDGVDGLVGGLSAVTFAACAVVSASCGNWALASVSAVWAASCAGYLPHNWNPARIFMGDCGSQLVGALQGVMVLLTFQDSQGNLNIPCALLLMLIPIGDMARVIASRLSQGKKIFSADRGHLHHILLDLKLRPRQICGILWAGHALTAALAALLFLS